MNLLFAIVVFILAGGSGLLLESVFHITEPVIYWVLGYFTGLIVMSIMVRG